MKPRFFRYQTRRPPSSHARSTGMCAALALVAAGCSSPAQPTGGVTAIALPRLSVTSFLAFGDSITAGAIAGADGVTLSFVDPSLAYPGELQTSLRQRYAAQPIVVVNDGLSGETAVDGAARLPTELSRYHPQVLLLLEGVNDLHGPVGQNGFPPAISALRSMIHEAKAAGAQVVVGTLPPAVPGALFPSTVALIEPFNAELMPMALESGALVVDLHSAFLPDVATWIGPDGLHLSVAGYQKLAQVFLASIQANFDASHAEDHAKPIGRSPR
jgi:acyl-CoA thioesterase-1